MQACRQAVNQRTERSINTGGIREKRAGIGKGAQNMGKSGEPLGLDDAAGGTVRGGDHKEG